jgi:hypothetical protein
MTLTTDIAIHLQPDQRIEFHEKHIGGRRWGEIVVVNADGSAAQEIAFFGSAEQVSSLLGRQEATV